MNRSAKSSWWPVLLAAVSSAHAATPPPAAAGTSARLVEERSCASIVARAADDFAIVRGAVFSCLDAGHDDITVFSGSPQGLSLHVATGPTGPRSLPILLNLTATRATLTVGGQALKAVDDWQSAAGQQALAGQLAEQGRAPTHPQRVSLRVEGPVSVEQVLQAAQLCTQAGLEEQTLVRSGPLAPELDTNLELARGTLSIGSLDKEQLLQTIHQRAKDVTGCYQAQLGRLPDLRGKVSVKMVIGETGQVVAASIANTTAPDPALERCLVAKVSTWAFPAPKGHGVVVVTYPFVLDHH